MLKKLAYGSLVLLLCVLIALTGCSTENSGKGESAEPSGQGTQGQGTEEGSGYTAVGTYPIVKDKITMSIFTRQDPKIEDYTTNEYTKYYEEKTNIHVDWQTVPTAALAEKLQVTLAGGKLPDVIMNAGLTPSQVVAYGSQGIFIPLNDLIDKYAPNIKQMMELSPDSKKYMYTPDGNIYGIPRFSGMMRHSRLPFKLWMNKTWLDKLNLEVPSTTEELYNVLKAFKTQDPNGNGKQDEVPYAGSAENAFDPYDYPDSYLMQSFIFYDRDNYVMVEDGKIIFAADKPGFKEGLKYMHRLVSEGLLLPESFTQDRKAMTALAENPDANLLGAGTSLWWGFFTVPDGPRYNEYIPVSIMAGPDGKRYGLDRGDSTRPADFVITKDAKDPIAAIRWLDHFYDKQNETMFKTGWSPTYGQEGKHWEKVDKPGEVGIDGKTKVTFRILVTPGTAGNYYWNQTVPSWSSDETQEWLGTYEVTPEMEMERVLYRTTVDMYLPYSNLEKKLPFMYFMPEDLTKFGDLQTNITNTVQQFLLRFVTGSMDIEKDWNKYLKELESAGLQQYLEVLQKTYDMNQQSKQ